MALASQVSGSGNAELNREIQTLPLRDRVAIVTGSSRGIGQEIALHLASLGARIFINYTSNLAPAESVATQVNSSATNGGNPRAIVVKADVSDPTHVKMLFDEAEKTLNSQVHILVNSAGVHDRKYSSISNLSLKDFDHIFRGSKPFETWRWGSHLVGSLTSGSATYAASKSAVETMMKISAKELKGTGITANCVAPEPIAMDMYFAGKTEEQVKAAIEQSPLCRLGETEDVAPLVGFLATDTGEWINGQVIRVNGGYV